MFPQDTKVWKKVASLPFLDHFTLNTGLFCSVILLNVLSNGFDLGIYNVIQAIDSFQNTFGDVYHPEGDFYTISTSHLSMLNSLPLLSYGASLLLAGLIGERYGRRVVYLLMNSICLIGIGVTWSSKSYGQILAGRMIVHGYIGFESWLLPLFLAEMVPAAVRGSLVALYMFGRLLGTLIISCICYTTSGLKGDDAWRIPVTGLFAIPSIALLLSFLVPESPRWLLRQGQKEKALKNLRYLNRDKTEEQVQQELALLSQSLEAGAHSGTWADLFRRPNTFRTMSSILPHFFALAAGQAFANVYATIFIKSLGIINPFVMTVISQGCAIAGSLFFVLTVDKLGRRFFWLTLAPCAALTMVVIGALGAARGNIVASPAGPHAAAAPMNEKTKVLGTAIASLFPVFGFFYLGSIPQLAALSPAEIPSLRLRDKTAMLSWSVQNLTNFVTTFTLPYLVNPESGNLGATVGFIYGVFGIMGVVWAYFYYPELTGRSLEEIDLMLGQDGVNAKQTKTWKAPEGSAAQLLHELENDTAAYRGGEKELVKEQVENA